MEYIIQTIQAYRRQNTDDPKATRLLPILEQIEKRWQKDRCLVIALDGRAASGKTTTANKLADLLGAGVVHMDDFFLPPQLRTKERLQQPGGNVHYERFAQQVLPYLRYEQAFCYPKFDCSQMDYSGQRMVRQSSIRIVEGAYSCHPFFGEYADIRIFSDIDAHSQMERIRGRNGIEMAEIFKKKWIPMEETYFEMLLPAKQMDCVI